MVLNERLSVALLDVPEVSASDVERVEEFLLDVYEKQAAAVVGVGGWVDPQPRVTARRKLESDEYPDFEVLAKIALLAVRHLKEKA